jgi:hypothetical protein
VVEADEQRHRLQARDAGDDLGPPHGVEAHDLHLVLVQRPGLAEDRGRHPDLAHVVQARRELELEQVRGGQAELLARAIRERRHDVRVALGLVVGRLQRPDEAGDLLARVGVRQLAAVAVVERHARQVRDLAEQL